MPRFAHTNMASKLYLASSKFEQAARRGQQTNEQCFDEDNVMNWRPNGISGASPLKAKRRLRAFSCVDLLQWNFTLPLCHQILKQSLSPKKGATVDAAEDFGITENLMECMET